MVPGDIPAQWHFRTPSHVLNLAPFRSRFYRPDLFEIVYMQMRGRAYHALDQVINRAQNVMVSRRCYDFFTFLLVPLILGELKFSFWSRVHRSISNIRLRSKLSVMALSNSIVRCIAQKRKSLQISALAYGQPAQLRRYKKTTQQQKYIHIVPR